jgi:hypothetical protein
MYDLKLVNTDMDWHRDSRLRITRYDGTSEISLVVYVTLKITSLWILCTNMDTAYRTKEQRLHHKSPDEEVDEKSECV